MSHLSSVIGSESVPLDIQLTVLCWQANAQFNTPINDSLSVTLDQGDLRAVTTAGKLGSGLRCLSICG